MNSYTRHAIVGDIVDIQAKGKSTGLFIVKDIQPGHTPTGWSVEFELINSEFFVGTPAKATLLLRTEHLAGEEFTINGEPTQIVLLTGNASPEPEQKPVVEDKIIRLF